MYTTYKKHCKYHDHPHKKGALVKKRKNKIPGPGRSKLTTSLANISLNFQTLISKICQHFLLKSRFYSIVFAFVIIVCISHFLNLFCSPSAFSRRAVVSYWRKYVHEVLVNRLGGLSLPRKSVVRLTDRPDMTLDVYRGRKTTMQQQQIYFVCFYHINANGRGISSKGAQLSP